jgi:hypothetical protein
MKTAHDCIHRPSISWHINVVKHSVVDLEEETVVSKVSTGSDSSACPLKCIEIKSNKACEVEIRLAVDPIRTHPGAPRRNRGVIYGARCVCGAG